MPTVSEIIRSSENERLDILAKSKGFLALVSGEAYERQYTEGSHVFVMLEFGRWSAWRETWRAGQAKSISSKAIVEKVPFEVALTSASRYVEYVSRYTNKHK